MDDGERISHLVGRTLAGRFLIEAHVGAGAMGDVFRGKHLALGSTVALKIMRSDLSKDGNFRERFNREAKAASRLDHPNSVRVIDFGQEPDGLVYLAMEFLSGRDLLALLRQEWPISDERIVSILSQTLGALTVAHGLGIVHRDLKPENIMIVSADDEDTKDHVKVCDFGIAKLSDPRAFKTENDGKALTTSGTLIGTPEYMSPEQARGDPLDLRSDLYSVGIILYQMLTGQVPFTAENALGVVLKQVTDAPRPPSLLRPATNPKLEAVCLRAIEKAPDRRYQTAKEMRADLRAAIGQVRIGSRADDSGLNQAPRDPDIESAPTVVSDRGIPSAPTSAGTLVQPVARPHFEPKQTSDGTALPVPAKGSRGSLGLLAGVAAVAFLFGGIGIVALMLSRRGRAVDPPPITAVASPSASSATPGTEPSSIGNSGAEPTAVAVAPTQGRPGIPGKPAPRGSGKALASALASAPAPLVSTASPPASAAAPPPSGPPATTYNPASAFVSLGALTTERVQQAAVRQKMSALLPVLSECYRGSLRNLGAPIGGAGSIHVSIDEKGTMQAIVSAPKNSEFARCAQNAFAGQRLPASAVESSGATAEQTISLVP